MSADPRIESIEGLLSAVESEDREEVRRVIAEVFHPECEWSPLIMAVEGSTYRGRPGMTAFYEDLMETFDVRYADREFRPVGDDAIVFFTTMRLRGKGSEIDVARDVGIVAEFEDGLMRRGRVYDSRTEAIEAAEALHA